MPSSNSCKGGEPGGRGKGFVFPNDFCVKP